MPSELSRRTLLKHVVATGSVWLAGSSLAGEHDQVADNRDTRSELKHEMSLSLLVVALRKTGKTVCLQEADRLEALPTDRESYDLSLRRAGLVLDDAVNIGDALQSLPAANAVRLRSLSVSFNPDLGDSGVMRLAHSFPQSLTELGVVGCDFGDDGAKVLLDWVGSATELRMICLEQNRLSTGMKRRFSALGKQRSGVMIVM